MLHKSLEKTQVCLVGRSSERQKRYRRKKHLEKYGHLENMTGKHKNHTRGSAHPRWNNDRIISSHGYVLIRVEKNHPHAFGNGYAYEHLLVWIAAGNPPFATSNILHHINNDKTDNRIENLELMTNSEHRRFHALLQPRNSKGFSSAID